MRDHVGDTAAPNMDPSALRRAVIVIVGVHDCPHLRPVTVAGRGEEDEGNHDGPRDAPAGPDRAVAEQYEQRHRDHRQEAATGSGLNERNGQGCHANATHHASRERASLQAEVQAERDRTHGEGREFVGVVVVQTAETPVAAPTVNRVRTTTAYTTAMVK